MPDRVHRPVVSATAALAAAIGGLISSPAHAGGGIALGGLTILQGAGSQSSQNSILNLNALNLNIGIGKTTTSNQPNSSTLSVNQVVGGLGPTILNGTLLANGVTNGNGTAVGSQAAGKTAGVPAVTSGLAAGKYGSNIPGLPNATVFNQEAGTAAAGGFAALVAPGMRSADTITATLGTVSQSAGDAFTLDFYGDRLITLAVNNQIASRMVDAATGKPLNALGAKGGKLSPNGGRVQLSAAAARAVVNSVVNNTGVIEASSIGTRNGLIVLGGATGKPTDTSAQTKLAGAGKGTKGSTNSGATTGALGGSGTALGGSSPVGGLIGPNISAASDVSAIQTVAGLLGDLGQVGRPIAGSLGAVTQSVTGAVNSLGPALTSSSFVSELVGGNVGGSVAQSRATGSSLVGGLVGNVVPTLTNVVGGVGLVNGKALTGLLATALTQTNSILGSATGLVSNVVPALTNVVGGVGLLNGNALIGLLATTLTQTDNLLGTVGNTMTDVVDVAATQVVAPPTDTVTDMMSGTLNGTLSGTLTGTLGSQGQNLVQVDDPLRLASLAPRDVVNAGGFGGPVSLPPQFGSRFFIPPPVGETRFISDEAVLHIPAGVAPAQIQDLMSRAGLSILASQRLALLGVTSYRVRIRTGGSVASVIRALAAYRIVAGAQPNYTYRLAQERTQNPGQETGQETGHEPELAGAAHEGDAAQYALGKLGVIGIHHQLKGTNIAVAVIDSQIDVRHPDLDGVIADQFDAVGQAESPHPHGTGMAGAIAAHHRLMGIAPGVRLYAIHAFSRGAANLESTTFNVLKGLDWAAGKGVRVINMSFAGPRDPSLERALKVAHDKGIVLIAAAGNAGPRSPPLYPGADPNVIAVTATDANDKLFSHANRGRYIAVAAPGVDILLPAPENGYQVISGTSVAAAEVSGVAALLLERNPNLKPEDIREILTSTATHLTGKDRDDDYGSGLVDPSRAVRTAGELIAVDLAGSLPRLQANFEPGR
jgi:subtilisin family serine protease